MEIIDDLRLEMEYQGTDTCILHEECSVVFFDKGDVCPVCKTIEIVIYETPNCPKCKNIKQVLDRMRIPYGVVDDELEVLELSKETGITTAPIIEFNGTYHCDFNTAMKILSTFDHPTNSKAERTFAQIIDNFAQ
jgi:glutaredoxin